MRHKTILIFFARNPGQARFLRFQGVECEHDYELQGAIGGLPEIRWDGIVAGVMVAENSASAIWQRTIESKRSSLDPASFARKQPPEQGALLVQECGLLTLQMFQNFGQATIALQQPSLSGLKHSAQSIRYQRRTIQAQPPQGQRSNYGERVECPIVQFDEVSRCRRLARIPQRRLCRTVRPVIGFVLVTTRAAIEQIGETVSPPRVVG
jgi:hypothetical protein